MSTTQFDHFKLLLSQAVQDTDFIRKNSLLQDSSYLSLVTSRVEALTGDIIIYNDYSDIISSLGLLTQNIQERTISFAPKGFDIPISEYREGSINSPRRLFNMSSAKSDGAKYLLADGGLGGTANGVLVLNQDMEILRRFPNFGTNVAGGEYADPSAAILFSVGGSDYIAIADYTNHVVLLYTYDGTHQATIGTVGNAGADATHLSKPNGLAFNNNTLYISCEDGQPAGATASNGFVAVWDVSTVNSPVFTSIPLYYSGTGAVLDNQVNTPVDVFHDGDNLWVVNSVRSEVGAFDMSGSSPLCVRYIEPSGVNYTLRTPQQIYIRDLVGGFKRLYIANMVNGTVEEFDGVTFKHLKTYGIRALEDNIGSYTRPSQYVFGALASPYGVLVDTVTIDEQDTNVLVVTDYQNGRIHRFNLDVYTDNNFVNFDWISYDVPIVITGWGINGNVPLDIISVQYRTSQTDQFQNLPQEGMTEESKTFQFRLQGKLSDVKMIDQSWSIDKLLVFGKMA